MLCVIQVNIAKYIALLLKPCRTPEECDGNQESCRETIRLVQKYIYLCLNDRHTRLECWWRSCSESVT